MLTEKEVRHVASLARLGLSDEEVGKMQGQLTQVLDYIAALEEIDTSAVPPTAQIGGEQNVLRRDTARPSLSNEMAIGNAARTEGAFFRVPAVLDDHAPDAQAPAEEAPDA